MRKIWFLVIAVLMLCSSSMDAQKRRAVRSPTPIEPAPFVIGVGNTPVAGGGTLVTAHFGDVTEGTFVQARVWSSASTTPVIDKYEVINVRLTDGSIWWARVYEGPTPANWLYCELLVTEPGQATKRAFTVFSVGGGSGPTRVATLDAGGGIHLDGFYLYRPVVIVPVPVGIALKSEGADFNYLPPTKGVGIGTLLTICTRVDGNANVRQCVTGPIEAQVN